MVCLENQSLLPQSHQVPQKNFGLLIVQIHCGDDLDAVYHLVQHTTQQLVLANHLALIPFSHKEFLYFGR